MSNIYIRNIQNRWNGVFEMRNLISGLDRRLGKSYGHLVRIGPRAFGSNASHCSPTGNPGAGVGKGGGGGGSVRESGGSLGEFAAAREEEFFYNKQREQLMDLKKKLSKQSKPGDIHKEEK